MAHPKKLYVGQLVVIREPKGGNWHEWFKAVEGQKVRVRETRDGGICKLDFSSVSFNVRSEVSECSWNRSELELPKPIIIPS